MDPIKLVFRGSLLLCLLSVNSLCAVLYVEIGALDDGGGFFSLSPLIDCIVWGVLIALSVLAAFLTRKSAKEHPLHIPEPLKFPAAYLATLAGLTVLILLLGLSGLLYEYNTVHLPLWGYVGLMTALYLSCGFFGGRRWGSFWKSAVLWGLLLTALLGLMGFLVLWNARLDEAMLPHPEDVPSYVPSITRESVQTILRHHFPGNLLGRINLPGCVVMVSYCYAVLDLPRETVTMLVCLCPPLLFTAGWLAGAGKCGGKQC